jgi:hypothetical protein
MMKTSSASFSTSTALVALLAAFVALPAAACGGGDDDEADASMIDAGTTPDGATASCTCVALGADYMAGVGTLATVHLPDLAVTTGLVPAGISGDPVVRAPGDGRIYVVNRFGVDNVTILDAADFSLIDQFSTGAGSNPQDIAVTSNKAFVVGLELGVVQVYDLTDTTAPPIEIDISSFDPDGVPNASSIAILGTHAFVTLGLLDSAFLPQGVGKVVMIDVNQDAVEGSFDLAFPNPTGFLRAQGANELLVSTADDYSGVTGCLERITTGVTPSSECEVMNGDLMGTVNAIAPGTGELFIVVTSYDPEFNPLGRIVHVQGTSLTDLTPAAQVVSDAAYCAATGQLVYTDQATGGVRVWNVAAGSEATTAPIDLGLPAAYSNGIVCY